MKTFLLIAALAAASPVFASAQGDTATIKVWGNCGMCEKTIEQAAKVRGVSSADWDTETKLLSLTYDKSKTSTDAIEKSIARAGYDTEHATADQKAYDKLHGCCQYDRK